MANAREQRQHPRVIGDFTEPLVLWTNNRGASAPLFPSQNSWQWFLRNHRQQLADAGAIGMHVGRLVVNEERCEEVAHEVAKAAVKRVAA